MNHAALPPRLHSHARIFPHAGLPALLVSNWRDEWNQMALTDLTRVVLKPNYSGSCLAIFVGSQDRVNAELVVPAERITTRLENYMNQLVLFRLSGAEGAASGVRLPLTVCGTIAASPEDTPDNSQTVELNFDTYWDSALASVGGLGVTFEDGITHLLVPKPLEDHIDDMLNGARSVTMDLLRPDRWKPGEICMQWCFEDGSDSPFILQLGSMSILGAVPNNPHPHRPVKIWIKQQKTAVCVASLLGRLLVQRALKMAVR